MSDTPATARLAKVYGVGTVYDVEQQPERVAVYVTSGGSRRIFVEAYDLDEMAIEAAIEMAAEELADETGEPLEACRERVASNAEVTR